MSITVKVEGFKELEKQLEQLSKSAGKGTLRRSLKSAAEPTAELANSMAPTRGGPDSLKGSFAYSTKLNRRQSKLHRKMFKDDRASVEGFVGTNNPAGVQQEFGNINHGPQPSLRPAWDSDQKNVLERLKKSLWEEIQKAVARAERKASRSAKKNS